MSDIKQCLNSTEQSMQKCVNHFNVELKKLRAGKAQPSMLDHLLVAYYGNPTPVNQVAAVSLADAKTIVVKPWEKSMIATIENAIIQSDLGVVPQNDGDIIRLAVPPLTEERRKDLVKQIKKEAEKSKTSIRTCRKQSKQALKNIDGISEDEIKKSEDTVQKLTDRFVKEVDQLLESKEKEVMKV